MNFNYLNQEDRVRLINNIKSENNKARKQESYRASEISQGRIYQYVREYLLNQLEPASVREMPIVSSINVQKAVVDKKAVIYKKKPERFFTELNEVQEEIVELVYKDMQVDEKLNKSNKNFVYQDQSIGMIVPKNGKLIMRILKMHQIDVVPSLDDPETAEAYIISAFDRTLYTDYASERKDRETATGHVGKSKRSSAMPDQDIKVAEEYQYQKYIEKYIVWSNEYNFMMNGLGEIINLETNETDGEIDITNPIGMMPFFEISREKDFEYFVRSSNTLSDFTIQFNASLSDLQNNCKMNGYSVAILKAPSDIQPNAQVIGASMLLKLPTDDPEKEVDFQFASPNSSIGEISDAIDKLLNYFVTSEGLGGNVVNARGENEKAQSGLDRYLMMLQKIEAHQDDFDMYKNAEHKIYELIKAWLNVLNGSDQLKNKYWVSLPEESSMTVKYHKPEMIETKAEKIATIRELIDLELMSKKQALMELHDITDDEKAQEMLDEIQADNNFNIGE